jgi:PPOX class probable F420-dependent enzyme
MQNSLASALAQFAKQNFLNLETFRKSGVAVLTPVWFVEDNGWLYVHTQSNAGKVKRIRNNGRVRLTPSDMRGNPLGQWVEGQATLLDPTDGERIHKLFKKKYGLQWSMFNGMGKLRKTDYVAIAIKIGDSG